MVRTAKLRGFSVRLSHHRSRVMTANVKKRPQTSVVSAHDNNRLARDVRRDVLPGLRQLIGARSELPRVGEHGSELEFVEVLIDIPRGGNCRCTIEREIGIVVVDDFHR